MTEHVYKKIEIVGSSAASIDDAIHAAVQKAAATVKNLRWFEVSQVRGEIEDGKVAHFQVTMML